jgi:hypothetical protein
MFRVQQMKNERLWLDWCVFCPASSFLVNVAASMIYKLYDMFWTTEQLEFDF